MTVFPYGADAALWIMQPRKVFQAQVNLPAASYPLAELPYDGVTLGAYTDLEQNQTVLIGSAPGLWDLGRTYLRGDGVWNVATSTVLNIGYSSRGRGLGSVDVQDNAYITVLDLQEVWWRPSRDGKMDGSLLKDYAIGVPGNYIPVIQIVDQNGQGGIGDAGYVDGGGVLSLDLDANGSYFTSPDGGETWNPLLTEWDVKDGTITSGVATDFAITAEFPPGYRYVRFRGFTSDAHASLPRMYLVVALDEDDPDAVPLRTAHKISWDEQVEGMSLQADLKERLDPADYIPGTVVMLLLDGMLTFAGYLDYDRSFASASLTDTARGTTIYCVDAAGRLDQLNATPSVVLRDADEPYYTTMKDAHLGRMIWRQLVFNTSAPMVSNVNLNYAYLEDFPFSQYGNGGGSQYSVPDTLARAAIARLTMSELGELSVIPDPMWQELDDRTSTVQATITEDDWSDLQRSKKRETFGSVRATGNLSSTQEADAITVAPPVYYGVAPGPIEAQGKGTSSSGFVHIVRSETELWRRLGQILARANPREVLMDVQVAPGLRGIHPARLTWVLMNASVDNVGWMDTPLVSARCLPAKVSYTYLDEAATITQRVTLERETDGPLGARDPRPVVTTTRIVRNPTLQPQNPPASFGLMAGTPTIAAFNRDGGMYLFSNFDSASPVAIRVNLAGLGMSAGCSMFIVDAFSPLYLGSGGSVNGMVLTGSGPEWLNDLFGTPTPSGDTLAIGDLFTNNMQSERVTEGLFVVANHPNDGAVDIYVTHDRGANWDTYTGIGGTYVGGSGDGVQPGLYVSAHDPDKFIFGAFVPGGPTGTGSLWQSLDGGATSTQLNPANTFLIFASDITVGFTDTTESAIIHGGPVNGGGFTAYRLWRTSGSVMTDISPTYSGVKFGPNAQFAIAISPQNADIIYVIGQDNDLSPTAGLWRSSDGGATWTTKITPVAGFPWTHVLVAGDNPDVIYLLGYGAGGLWLGYSTDGGATVQDKSGNIPTTYAGAGEFVNLAGG